MHEGKEFTWAMATDTAGKTTCDENVTPPISFPPTWLSNRNKAFNPFEKIRVCSICQDRFAAI